MIRIGIICRDTTQIEEITNLIYSYTHMPPRHRMRGLTEWVFPLLSIEIRLPLSVRGCKYDIGFYDEGIDEDIVNDVIYPCCFCYGAGKPRPLKEFLWRFPEWKNMIIAPQ